MDPTGTTIAAIASPPGGGRRGILRLSGPRVAAIVAETCAMDGQPLTLARRGAFVARFHDGRGEQPALVLWMPAPRSFTREDQAELHLPGAPPLLRAALARVLARGAIPAPPGEFTRRAFLNGRIDLSRAQGVLALVSARTREERRAATALVSGGLDERTRALRGAMEDLRALCEASLDFDESDTGHVPQEELLGFGERVRAGLAEARRWEEGRARSLGLPRVVLRGRPNAGKSRLFNALLGDERALVDERVGTTRDVLRARWRVGEHEMILCDTAGADPLARGLEASAQERARREQEAADLVLLVVDAADPFLPDHEADLEGEHAPSVILVWNKIDLGTANVRPPRQLEARHPAWAAVSAASGQGLDELRRGLSSRLGQLESSTGAGRELAESHRLALDRAAIELDHALADLVTGVPLDLVAEGLRRSNAALDGIDGRTTPEDILARIFARFCIGK